MTADTVDRQLASLLARYAGPDVALGEVLCDAHEGVALDYDGPRGSTRLSYGELRERSSRLAAALREVGVEPGSTVAVMLPKSPELLVSLLAIWRLGAVHIPLFTAFGPDSVAYRVEHSGARVAITDASNRAKLDKSELLQTVFCLTGPGRPGDEDLDRAIERGDEAAGVTRAGDDLLMVLYTSGTTGQPKGVEVPVRSLAAIHSYMHYGLDLRPDDVFWNIADPGWGYGLWFGLVGPLLLGQTTLLRDVRFDAEDVLATIVDRGVTNLTGAPTVFRALRGGGVPASFRSGSRLRAVSSAGEPLNAELLDWSARELGSEIHDHYGQSELGMTVGFAHHPSLHRDPVPGSMGFAAPGFRVVVLDDAGREAPAGAQGELAIDVEASPLYWFRGYFRDPERTAERFRQGPRYYLTGDSASLDESGLAHFASRADDVITSSGYRIGPFEVESALMAHPAVVEVGVIGTPDALRGEAVTAFVVTAAEATAGPKLADELQRFVKSRLAAHLYPRRVVFVDSLPRTPSGKVQRSVLRRRWEDGPVRLRVADDVLWALIDRPATRNAIDLDVLAGLERMVATAREQRVKVVVIRGAAGTFCSGADLGGLRRMADDGAVLASFMTRFGVVLQDLERAPWVNVAVLEGHAVAGGCELLLAADIAVAATDARIGDGHVNYGLVPAAGASVRLPRALPPAVARYLLLTGDVLSGTEAARQGLVTTAVEPKALDAEVERIVSRLSARGSATLSTVKRMLTDGAGDELRPLLRRELELFLEHVRDADDVRIGLNAFSARSS